MPFSQQKLDQVKAGIDRALYGGSLNEWERTFLSDMRTRLDRDGRRTSLSEKQYRKLMQLAGIRHSPEADPRSRRDARTGTRGSTTSGQKGPIARPGLNHKRRRPSRIERKLVRKGRSFVFAVIALGALGFLGVINPESKPSRLPTGGSSAAVRVPTPERDQDRAALRAASVSVIDGDTVSIAGYEPRIRLVGFNTPEVFSPRCNSELELGNRATSRLRQLLREAEQIRFQRVACSCKPGTEGTRSCNYGRLCGSLYVDGRDVGNLLVSEGLAARYQCGRYSCPPPTGNWCG